MLVIVVVNGARSKTLTASWILAGPIFVFHIEVAQDPQIFEAFVQDKCCDRKLGMGHIASKQLWEAEVPLSLKAMAYTVVARN